MLTGDDRWRVVPHIYPMRYIAALLLGLSLAPLDAGQAHAWWWSDDDPAEASKQAPLPEAPLPDAKSEIDEGTDLLQRGAELLFEGLRKEMEPALGDLRDSLGEGMAEIQPALRDLAAMIGDARNYEAPVQLPNGDIVIRRKADAPPFVPKSAPGIEEDAAPSAKDGGIEL